jgi:hypothetical protein
LAQGVKEQQKRVAERHDATRGRTKKYLAGARAREGIRGNGNDARENEKKGTRQVKE